MYFLGKKMWFPVMWALDGMMHLHTIYHTFRSRISLCVYPKTFQEWEDAFEWRRWFIYLGITCTGYFLYTLPFTEGTTSWAELGWYRSLYASDTLVHNGYYTDHSVQVDCATIYWKQNDKTWIKPYMHTQRRTNHISNIKKNANLKMTKKIKSLKAGRDLGHTHLAPLL